MNPTPKFNGFPECWEMDNPHGEGRFKYFPLIFKGQFTNVDRCIEIFTATLYKLQSEISQSDHELARNYKESFYNSLKTRILFGVLWDLDNNRPVCFGALGNRLQFDKKVLKINERFYVFNKYKRRGLFKSPDNHYTTFYQHAVARTLADIVFITREHSSSFFKKKSKEIPFFSDWIFSTSVNYSVTLNTEFYIIYWFNKDKYDKYSARDVIDICLNTATSTIID